MPDSNKGWISFGRYSLLFICLILILIGSKSCLYDTIPPHGRDAEEIHILATYGEKGLPEVLDGKTILIPAGTFIMGSDKTRQDESPEHSVYLDAFEIDQFEITNIQYQRFIIEKDVTPPRYWDGQDYPNGQDIYPVVGVRWKDADAYCKWVGKRLPTEAEWEKACRGTNGLIYPWGNLPKPGLGNIGSPPGEPNPDMWEEAWTYLVNNSLSGDTPKLDPIGSYPAGVSPYGVFDLVGGASEWTADRYNWDGYWEVPAVNPLVLEPAWNHVARGSAWLMPFGKTLDGFDYSRCSARNSSHGDTRDARMGFRCAKSIPVPAGK